MKLKETSGWPLARFVVPAFPEVNIYSRTAKKTTSLGLINIASAANKLWGWRVKVIDENNYRGPRDSRGLPDHAELQKENFASAAGFYCGLTSTMDRVFELAKFYRSQNVITIAGGLHVHYLPEEALDNNIDVVAHGDGEFLIREILGTLNNEKYLFDIPGISFSKNNRKINNPPEMIELADLNGLPYPDFGLLEYSKKMKIYPIGRVRGCGMNCEFCSVRGRPRQASPQHLFNIVKWLVETRKAKKFFIVDDRLEEDIAGASEFFELIYEKYGDRLDFTVQIRLDTAKKIGFLKTMKKAGVTTAAIGYESPIDEDLRAMGKGYLSANMLEWTKILREYFWVHGMFIFGYPEKQKMSAISVEEKIRRFKKFIREGKISTIQVLHPVPIVGSELRKRLEKENRIFPADLVPWNKYDGNYPCFIPDNMKLEEFQEAPITIMKWFYSPFNLVQIPLRIISFPFHYLIAGWKHWFYGWWRGIARYGGHLLLRKWRKSQNKNFSLERLKRYQLQLEIEKKL